VPPRLFRLFNELVDLLAAARSHPEWFLHTGSFEAEEAIGLLTAEALRGGAQHVGWTGPTRTRWNGRTLHFEYA
jgi:hypothetical protein